MARSQGRPAQTPRPGRPAATPPEQPASAPPGPTSGSRWLHGLLVVGILGLCAVLAITSLITDSITFDETAHLAAGMSYLKTGDFRLSPEHPPLSKVWAAWPLLFVHQRWPAPDHKFWCGVDLFNFGRLWLFSLNDGQHLVVIGRCMMVVLLLGTCLTTYALARTLFGPTAGLLALTLAALGPELLAHGRLVTTDQPIVLCAALTLLTFAWLMRRLSWPRLLAAALALTATSLSKFSWPLILPALVVMACLAVFGRRPIELATSGRHLHGAAVQAGLPRLLTRRRERVAAGLGAALFIGLVTWLGIWTCYGWRRSIIAPLPAAAESPAAEAQLGQAAEKLASDWQQSLHRPNGTPRSGLLPAFLRLVLPTGLLPDAYLLGLALTLHYSGPRLSYLLGQCGDTGWLSYFPIAFSIKTPIATLLLLLAGLAALVLRATRSRDGVLLTGLLVFAAVYAAYMINGRLNIGLRHLLPVYPAVYVLAGASATWLRARVGRWLVGAALAWLLAANLWIHPHYLSYFNELVGGPARGHLYLADSNIDWGQDLLHLAAYSRAHPEEPIKLAYFGSALPRRYVDCTALPSYLDFMPRAELTAGTYVVSVTQLLGVYDPEVRDAFWAGKGRRGYAGLAEIAALPAADHDSPELREKRTLAASEHEQLRYKRLLNRLGHRPPDQRIGYSLFVYRLSAADVDELTRP